MVACGNKIEEKQFGDVLDMRNPHEHIVQIRDELLQAIGEVAPFDVFAVE